MIYVVLKRSISVFDNFLVYYGLRPFSNCFSMEIGDFELVKTFESLIGVHECVCLVHEQGVLSGLISNLFPHLCEMDLTKCARFEDHAAQQHHQSLLLI